MIIIAVIIISIVVMQEQMQAEKSNSHFFALVSCLAVLFLCLVFYIMMLALDVIHKQDILIGWRVFPGSDEGRCCCSEIHVRQWNHSHRCC